MSELNTETQLFIKLLAERLTKTQLSYQSIVSACVTERDKGLYQGKADGLQTAKDIIETIKGEIK